MPRKNKNGSRGRTKTNRMTSSQTETTKKTSKKERKKKQHQKSAEGVKSPKKRKNTDSTQKNKKFVSPDKRPTGKIPAEVEGILELHPDGFGFLIADDPEIPNLYVVEESLSQAMHRDRIRVKVMRGDEKPRSKMIEVTGRHSKEIFAIYRPFKGGAILVPSDARNRHHAFKIENTLSPIVENLKAGANVLAQIIEYPNSGYGLAKVTEEVELLNTASADTLKVLVEAAWPREFTKEAVSEAESLAKIFEDNPRQDSSLRRDITDLPLVTIDGSDARDFDDAVCAQEIKGGRHKLWVAIADVSHFVKPLGKTLDKEAFERSTSVYFPDFVVPMLPETLSNGVCSLNPEVLRNCMVAEMTIAPNGKIETYELYQGLMKSKKRMTYEDMQAFMDGDKIMRKELHSVEDSLFSLIDVFKKLRTARLKRGSVELDIPEAFVQLNTSGEVVDIQTRTRTDSHKLIEECMLIANTAAAKFLKDKSDEAVYRIHEAPDEKKIQMLKEFLSLNAINYDSSFEEPADFAKLTELLQNSDIDDSLKKTAQTLVLRSFQQARYAPHPMGHFALANPDYTHFTSPIRRYPDLMVHRLIKNYLGVEKYPGPTDLEYATRHCSDQERKAMDAERKLIDIKKCRYMEPYIGEDFKVWVSGITERGVFCQVEGHFVDGFVKSMDLSRAFKLKYDAGTQTYRGPSNTILRLGSWMMIKVAAVSVETRKIDFDPLELIG